MQNKAEDGRRSGVRLKGLLFGCWRGKEKKERKGKFNLSDADENGKMGVLYRDSFTLTDKKTKTKTKMLTKSLKKQKNW